MPRLKRTLRFLVAVSILAAATAGARVTAETEPLAIPDAPPSTPDLDAARGLISTAVERYRALHGYQARYEKDELGDDGRLKEEKSFFKFEKPFILYMLWDKGERKDTHLLYAQDHYDDKMIMQMPGLLFSFVGPVTIATDDPRVAKDQKHSIKKAGIGFFIEDLWSDFQRLELVGGIEARGIEKGVDVEGERGTLVDLELRDPQENYPRKAVVISEKTGLPIEIRLYKPDTKLVETFRYLDLVPNPPADDPAFRKIANPALFKKYVEAASPGTSSQHS